MFADVALSCGCERARVVSRAALPQRNGLNDASPVCHSSTDKKRRPMGKLVYNLLSMSELKRRLKECHLSTHGPRDQLVKRHQNFVHMYNAECDSLNPKSGNVQTLICYKYVVF